MTILPAPSGEVTALLEPPRLVLARSAVEESDLADRAQLGGLAALGLMVLAVVALPPESHAVPLAMPGVVGVVCAIVRYRAETALRRKWQSEQVFGYTTLYDPRMVALWQLEPRTGRVLRRPGDPPIARRRGRAG